MKITKEVLEQVVRDDEGKPFEDGTTHAKLLLMVARSNGYMTGDGRAMPFDESPDDKIKVGMAAFKVSKATKHVVFSSDDIRLLKARAAKLFNAPTYVRFVDMLEEKASAESRAEKENDDVKEEKKPDDKK